MVTTMEWSPYIVAKFGRIKPAILIVRWVAYESVEPRRDRMDWAIDHDDCARWVQATDGRYDDAYVGAGIAHYKCPLRGPSTQWDRIDDWFVRFGLNISEFAPHNWEWW